jgi:phosphoribosylanthranilate isomerase
MKTRPQIKVCGLTRTEDIELVCALGADYCGFILYPKSPRALSIERAAELSAHVPQGKRVAVDVAPTLEKLEQMRLAGFDYFQLHYKLDTPVATLAAWSDLLGKEHLWLAPRVGADDAFPLDVLSLADTILVDTYAKQQIGGTGRVGDWARFAQLKESHPQIHWVLAGGLGPHNALDAIAATHAAHLDLNSGVESSPGIKDPEKLRAVFHAIRAEA